MIKFEMHNNASSEGRHGFDRRLKDGFWERNVREGIFIDLGYGIGSAPIFADAIGLETDTPGYNGKDIPFADNAVGTIHTSHVLEHIEDYQSFIKECFRALRPGGTLILIVPLMQAYENRDALPSQWNPDHKRFYTAATLLIEIETTIPRKDYKVIHLAEWFNVSDIGRASGHATRPYEIELVIEKQ
jgi:SAM-dependent methyltransferase